jgi:hypothetical protein
MKTKEKFNDYIKANRKDSREADGKTVVGKTIPVFFHLNKFKKHYFMSKQWTESEYRIKTLLTIAPMLFLILNREYST